MTCPTTRAQAHLVHLVQDPALHRLEAVPRVGERALVDGAIRVFEIAGAHLLGDVDVDDIFFEIFRRRGGTASSCSHTEYSASPAGPPGPATPEPTSRRIRRPRTASARSRNRWPARPGTRSPRRNQPANRSAPPSCVRP